MKAKIYNRDGTERRVLEVTDLIHLWSGFYGLEMEGGHCVKTNLPVHIEGIPHYPEIPPEVGVTESVCLFNDSGAMVRRWNRCRCLDSIQGGYYFYTAGQWMFVSGNIIVELEKKES